MVFSRGKLLQVGPGGPREERAGLAGGRRPAGASSPGPAPESDRGPGPGDPVDSDGSENFHFPG